MKRIYSLFLAAVLLASARPVFSETPSARALEVLPSARIASMGTRCAAMSEGIDSIFSNPAGLSVITRDEFSFSSFRPYEGASFQHAAYAYDFEDVRVGNVYDLGAVAVSMSALDWGLQSAAGAAPSHPVDRITQLTYAKPVFSDSVLGSVFVGLSAKSVSEEFRSSSGDNFSFDSGILIRHPWHKLSAGISLLNYADYFSYKDGSYDLPRTLNAGLASVLLKDSLVVGADYTTNSKSQGGYGIGAEYFPGERRIFALRAGYNSLGGDYSGLSYGAGLILKNVDVFFFYAYEMNLDYAYIPRDTLSGLHKLSLTIKLGAD